MGEELTSLYPVPSFDRSDNGPEFIAHALRRWCKISGTTTAYIEPRSPWQNGFAESFNSRLQDEFLNTAAVRHHGQSTDLVRSLSLGARHP